MVTQCGENGSQRFSSRELLHKQNNSPGGGEEVSEPTVATICYTKYPIINNNKKKNEETCKETKCNLYPEANVKSAVNTKGLRGSLDLRFNKDFKAAVKNMFQN